MSINLKALVERLNTTTRSTLEAAAGLCLSRTHYDVEVEHYLLKLLDNPDTDATRILSAFGVDKSRLTAELMKSLDRLKTGNARTPVFSPHLMQMFTEAWTAGSINYGAGQVRSGLTILALATNDQLQRLMRDVSKEFQKIAGEALAKDFTSIVAGSSEEAMALATSSSRGAGAAEGGKPAGASKTPFLDQYASNLTERAKQGKLDPVLGRDAEIRQVIDILMRRRQNNPIMTGEAGVGKTAVVEGFAQRVAAGDVPKPLRGVAVHSLDLALLQAGAGVKGEFENRLKGLIEEVKSSPTPIILFIDEAHTMIGAGGTAGQNDAANLLKPALARGELRTIAATTWSEYKKYFEKDAALARRFQVVKVEEPSEKQCMTMLRGFLPSLEKHHEVRILDEGLNAAVSLSHRYIAGRQLPDKAVSILDTACARLALGQQATPPMIEDLNRRLDDLAVQKRNLEREVAVGADHSERLQQIADEQTKSEQELKDLTARWEKESGLVNKLRELRRALENPAQANGDSVAADTASIKKQLQQLEAELDALQGEKPLMRVCVDRQIVSEVIAAWTGIPVGKMVKNEIDTVLKLNEVLGQRIIGQDQALSAIAERIVTSKASLDDPSKPIGTFMLVGPSGVGKTETALALADLLYGGEDKLITINMSEFQEAHTVSTLKGSPPGYVGYGEGGVLTEAVRRRPYSVVLLDEVEKAHLDVLELFFQVFDKGMMEDGEGREIDFKNTIIILTTNACTDTIMKLTADPETAPLPEALAKELRPELNKTFKPAFIGRLLVVPFYPVRDEVLKKIVTLKLGKIKRRLMQNHRVELTWDDAMLNEVAKRCTEVESGARNVDNVLTHTLLPEVSRLLLGDMAAGQRTTAINVSVGEDGRFQYQQKHEEVAAGATA